MATRAEMMGFLNDVAKKITIDWKPLGRKLKIPEAKLEALDDENSKIEEKAYQTLLKWYRKFGHSKATKEVLFEALRAIERTATAEELEKEYGITAEEKRRPMSEVIIRCYSSLEPTDIKKSKTVPQIEKPRLNVKHITREDKEFRERSGAFSGECPQPNIEITFPSSDIQPKVEEEDKSSECPQSSQNNLQVETTPQIVIQLQVTQGEIQSRHPDSAECPQLNQCTVEIPFTCAEFSKTKKNNAKITYPTIIIQLQFQEQDGNSSNEILKCVDCYQKVSEDLVEKESEETKF